MSSTADIIEGLAEAFDEIRAELFDENTRVFLAKRTGNSGKLTGIAEIASGWLMEFNEFRGQMMLSVATIDQNFADLIAQTSFVAYGAADSAGQMEVFSIDPDRRDVVPPNGTSPFWKVYVSKDPKERFSVPIPEPEPEPEP